MLVPAASEAGAAFETSAPLAVTVHACLSPARRLASSTRDPAAMLASASPRNPRLATRSRSGRLAILLVAWRARASFSSSRGNAASVVHHLDLVRAAAREMNRDVAIAGVQAVLEQFLERGGGPLD